MKIKDLSGQRVGKLTAIKCVGKNKYGRALWLCRCDCGNKKVINSNSLLQSATKSCGCLDKEKHITNPNRIRHGHSGERIYRIWKKMKSRCHNQNDPDYQKYYVAKDIKVCDNWRYNFWMFYNWSICHGYKDNLTIDRIDNSKGYCPENCRWTTSLIQRHNQNRCIKGGDSN